MKRLIINADDYGYGAAFNRGILECAAAGAITSTTVLIGGPALDAAILDVPGVSVGLHLDLTPARPVADQVEDQIARFAAWAGRPPSHLDSHHHRHVEAWALPDVATAAKRHGLPVRSRQAAERDYLRGLSLRTPDACFGRDDPTAGDLAALAAAHLAALVPGVTEWYVHPGYPDPAHPSRYNAERAEDLAVLLSPDLAARLAALELRLISYSGLMNGAE